MPLADAPAATLGTDHAPATALGGEHTASGPPGADHAATALPGAAAHPGADQSAVPPRGAAHGAAHPTGAGHHADAGHHTDAAHGGGDPHGHPAALQPTADVAAPQLHNPRLAAAARTIQRSAATQKQAIHAAAESQHRAVVAHASSHAAAIEQTAAQKIAAVQAHIAGQRAAVSAAFAAARAAISSRAAAQKAAIQADGTKALGDLKKLIADKQKAAKAGAEKEAKALETTGQNQATHAHSEMNTTISAINSAAASACASAGGDADVQKAVNDAVNQAKSDAIAKTHQQGNDVASKAQKDAKDAAQKIREGGDKLAGELGDKSSQVETSIQDATQAASARVAAGEQSSLQQLTDGEHQALAGLDHMRASAAPPLRSAASRAAAQARATGSKAGAALNHAATAQLHAIDHATRQAHGVLQSVPHGSEVNDAALDHSVTRIDASFVKIHTEGAAALTGETGKLNAGLSSMEAKFRASASVLGGKTESAASAAVAHAHQAIDRTRQAFDTECTQARNDLHQAHSQAITRYGSELDHKITAGNQKWAHKRTDSEQKIHDDVDKGLKGIIDMRSQVGPKFQGIADKAKQKAKRPWWQKALSGIWEGLKSFVGGLLVFIAAVLIVALVVLLFVSGIGEALALALEIVGVCFLVYSLISSEIGRWKEFLQRAREGHWNVWQMIGGGALATLAGVGDVFGVTQLVEAATGYDAVSWQKLSTEERWKRGTEGALTLITLGLLKRAKVDAGDTAVGDGAGDGGRGGERKGGGSQPTRGGDQAAHDPTPPRTEPTRTEPTRTEPTRTEPTRTEPTRTEPTDGGAHEHKSSGLQKMETGASRGVDPTPESIRQGTVRMEDHPDFPQVREDLQAKGYEFTYDDGQAPKVKIVETVDADGEPIGLKKYLIANRGMRWLDLEHELGHVDQMESMEHPLVTDRVLEDGKPYKGPNRGGFLTEQFNAITEYHNRLIEYFRLEDRGVDPATLEEHADGVRYWRERYESKGTKRGRSQTAKEFIDKNFPDLPGLDARWLEEGGTP
ncbi:MAG TPA: hypothetical protein VHW23_29390 [Kofleriaceae bacterium]|nr:hypothetical protein [Kofleriaceae bacterium]